MCPRNSRNSPELARRRWVAGGCRAASHDGDTPAPPLAPALPCPYATALGREVKPIKSCVPGTTVPRVVDHLDFGGLGPRLRAGDHVAGRVVRRVDPVQVARDRARLVGGVVLAGLVVTLVGERAPVAEGIE